MLKRTQGTIAAALLAYLALFYANEIWRSPERSYQPAHQTSTQHTEHKQSGENILGAFWRWTTHDPVAFYTSVLALFTGVLTVVSFIQIRYLIRADLVARKSSVAARRSAIEAKKAADHIPTVERAYLHVVIVNETISGTALRLATNQDKLTGNGHVETKPSVHYKFKNYGKTPALLKEISRTITPAVNLPDEIDYVPVDTVPKESFVAAGEPTEEWPPCSLSDTISTQDWASIVRGQRTVWFYGQVVYDDIFGDEHVHRFVWKYSGGSHGFRPVQHPKHSKST
jgi:hypothetical protein